VDRSQGETLNFIEEYLQDTKMLIDLLPIGDIQHFVEAVCAAYDEDRQVFVVGNGGSAATASHMACDLGKTVLQSLSEVNQKRLKVLSLTDNVSLITAWANDVSYDLVFAEQLRTFARPGDLLIVISGSGKSPSVVEVVQAAREMGLTTVGLLGFDGGRVRTLVDRYIIVGSDHYGHVEDLHLLLNHLLTAYLRRALVGHRDGASRGQPVAVGAARG